MKYHLETICECRMSFRKRRRKFQKDPSFDFNTTLNLFDPSIIFHNYCLIIKPDETRLDVDGKIIYSNQKIFLSMEPRTYRFMVYSPNWLISSPVLNSKSTLVVKNISMNGENIPFADCIQTSEHSIESKSSNEWSVKATIIFVVFFIGCCIGYIVVGYLITASTRVSRE